MVAPVHSPPKVKPGQLVQHRRYGYRGVVVALDPSCRASDDWYHRNKTQPPRSQPWYHILVDGGEVTTYAAETSLKEDSSGRPIEHPLVKTFFSALTAGVYVRNDRPWPED